MNGHKGNEERKEKKTWEGNLCKGFIKHRKQKGADRVRLLRGNIVQKYDLC